MGNVDNMSSCDTCTRAVVYDSARGLVAYLTAPSGLINDGPRIWKETTQIRCCSGDGRDGQDDMLLIAWVPHVCGVPV